MIIWKLGPHTRIYNVDDMDTKAMLRTVKRVAKKQDLDNDRDIRNPPGWEPRLYHTERSPSDFDSGVGVSEWKKLTHPMESAGGSFFFVIAPPREKRRLFLGDGTSPDAIDKAWVKATDILRTRFKRRRRRRRLHRTVKELAPYATIAGTIIAAIILYLTVWE